MSVYAKIIPLVCFLVAMAGYSAEKRHGDIVSDVYSPPGKRTISFPKEQSIGKYTIVDWDYDPTSVRFNHARNWPQAKGDVAVPEGKALILLLLNTYDDAPRPQDFSPLDKLGPKDIVGFLPHPFGKVVPSELERLKRFRSLQLLSLSGFNGVKADQCTPVLAAFTQLKFLALQETGITDSGMAYLKNLKALESLDIYGARITDKGLSYLSGLTNLRSLGKMGSTAKEITDAGIAHLKDLKKLERLHLGGTQITDAGLVHLKGLTNLQYLDLSNTKVTDAGLVHLKALPDLKHVTLPLPGVTEKKQQEMRRFLENRERRKKAQASSSTSPSTIQAN